jgi:hypothetical protein
MRRRLLLQALAMTGVLSGCAELGIPASSPPPPRGRVITGNGNGGGSGGGNGAPVLVAGGTITASDARRLAVQNGLTGYKSLPPGIQRSLARGKRLPPGLERRVVPGGMLGQLPTVEDHEWRIAGRDLILVAIATLIVVQILNDVFS